MTRAYNSIKMFYYYASISRGKIGFHKAAENKKKLRIFKVYANNSSIIQK